MSSVFRFSLCRVQLLRSIRPDLIPPFLGELSSFTERIALLLWSFPFAHFSRTFCRLCSQQQSLCEVSVIPQSRPWNRPPVPSCWSVKPHPGFPPELPNPPPAFFLQNRSLLRLLPENCKGGRVTGSYYREPSAPSGL